MSRSRGIAILSTTPIGLVDITAFAIQGQRVAIPIAIGIDLPLTLGAAIDPSDKNAADLYKGHHPNITIKIDDSYNNPDAKQALNELEQAAEERIRFFINTQASSHAVECLDFFPPVRLYPSMCQQPAPD